MLTAIDVKLRIRHTAGNYKRRAKRRVFASLPARRLSTSNFRSGLVAIGEQNQYSFPPRWVTLDRRDSDISVLLDAQTTLPFPDRSQRIVYAAHILEHLDDDTIHRLLLEIHRILRKGGGVRVEVPDAGFLLDAWRNHDESVLAYFRKYRENVIVNDFGFNECYIEDHLTPLGEIANYLLKGCHVPVYAPLIEFEENASYGLDQLNSWAQSLKTTEQAHTPGHRNALTFAKLESMFNRVGFTRVFKSSRGNSVIDGLRLGSNVRSRWDSIAEKSYRQFYSLYIDAIKD